jgi:hypothetical protein
VPTAPAFRNWRRVTSTAELTPLGAAASMPALGARP